VLGQTTSNTDSLNSPRSELGGSHHLPPYSILYVAPPHLHPNGFYSRDSQGGVLKLSWFGLPRLWELITSGSDLELGWGLKKTCSSLQDLSNGYRTPPAHTEVGSIPDFLLSGVKLPVWLLALLSTITCVVDVRMAYTRPFSTSKLQGLSNDIKNTSRRGVLTSAIELWSYGSPGGLQVPTFGSVSLIFTLASKWGCNICLVTSY
jgi:hypothetical protein